MPNTISNTDDTIDSRDVIARIEELEAERDDYASEIDDKTGAAGVERRSWAESNPDEAAELKALQALAEEAEGYAPDWKHGEQLIRDSYFERFAQELADDLGYTNAEVSWPHTCIDWERAARELRMDYTGVDFDGVTYWVR